MTETAAPPSVAGLAPLLTPRGRLRVAAAEDAPALAPEVRQRLEDAFGRGAGHGLLQLGAGEREAGVTTPLPRAEAKEEGGLNHAAAVIAALVFIFRFLGPPPRAFAETGAGCRPT
jgi:hypothetical protein